ncbi:MAG: hypothetical protein A3F67_11615 [Verrucomicrobia bacterium RIFCSPHIGHO2_12_FULL_41_10]|nr:MAG: hypothetical protein A3F67_11615 [Verrucomicrobia bacterium RIFCSPHIGHO2_12_FULL_41_10]
MRFLKFWGTRGSCPVSGPQFSKFGGNTACLEIRYDKCHFIIDAGTGILPLGVELDRNPQEKIQIFLGHPHLDHLIGFPFFEPAFRKDQEIAFWLPAKTEKNGKDLLTQFLAPEIFPGGFEQIKALLRFFPAFEEIPVQMEDVTLHFCQVCHPGITYGFKIVTPNETIGYVTDHEFLKGYFGPFHEIPPSLLAKEEKVISFFRGVDLLIHEAQFSAQEYQEKKGWGHSSLSNVLALIKAAQIKKWFVVHHDPKHTDADLEHCEEIAKKMLFEAGLPCEVQWIPDGYVHKLN